jgi:hypothetical protein
LQALLPAVQEYPQAIRCCDSAYELDPSNWKIVLRRGKASSLNGDYADAQGACAVLQESNAADDVKAEARELLAANKRREVAAAKKQQGQFANLFDR